MIAPNDSNHSEPGGDSSAKKREEAAAEKREKERAHQDATLAVMRADLAAGVDLDIVVKRTLSAGIRLMPVEAFVHQPLRRPRCRRFVFEGDLRLDHRVHYIP